MKRKKEGRRKEGRKERREEEERAFLEERIRVMNLELEKTL